MSIDLIIPREPQQDVASTPLEGEVIMPNNAQNAHLSASRAAPQTVRVKVKKYGFLGAFLRPIGMALATLILVWGVFSMGTSYYRGYQRHLDYAKASHEDKSTIEVLLGMAGPALSTGETKFTYRDIDGRVHRVVAATSAVDRFVNQNLITLDRERDQIVARVERDMEQLFRTAFEDRNKAIDNYADWFFEWKRSYVILKEAITSTATRLFETGKFESLKEAVGRDVKDYFLKNYRNRVLQPEKRDQVISVELNNLVRRAHQDYRLAMMASNTRLQTFLQKHTRHLDEVAPGEKLVDVRLDWDAQQWKAPVHMVEDRAFDGIVGVGSMAAGGTFGALALGPLMSRTVAASFAALSRTVVTSMGSRIALAEGGAAAGTAAAPGIGTAIGTGIGLALGAGADYLLHRRRAKKGRKAFLKANNEALDLTISQWRGKLNANVTKAVDRWFHDARASMILSHKRKSPAGQAPQKTDQDGSKSAPMS